MASTTLSAPAPPVSSRICSTGSPAAASTGMNPISEAMASLRSSISTTSTRSQPAQAHPLRRHVPDRSSAEDRGGDAGPEGELAHAVKRHGAGLGEGRVPQARRLWDGHEVCLGRPDALCKGAVAPRSEVVVVHALGVVAGLAGRQRRQGMRGKTATRAPRGKRPDSSGLFHDA